MFTPSRDEARQFLFDAWRKYRAGEPLEGLDRVAVGVIVLHPEYHRMLEDPDRFLDRDYRPESGEANPFLHLSLHVAIEEQISIDQPPGIRAEHDRLCVARGDEHHARHDLLECLAETIWHAQRHGTPFDAARYLGCLAGRPHGS